MTEPSASALAHKLRSAPNTAISFENIQRCRVASRGSTGLVHARARALIGRIGGSATLRGYLLRARHLARSRFSSSKTQSGSGPAFRDFHDENVGHFRFRLEAATLGPDRQMNSMVKDEIADEQCGNGDGLATKKGLISRMPLSEDAVVSPPTRLSSARARRRSPRMKPTREWSAISSLPTRRPATGALDTTRGNSRKRRWPLLRSTLDCVLDIFDRSLGVASKLIELAVYFELVIARHGASDLLDLAFGLVDDFAHRISRFLRMHVDFRLRALRSRASVPLSVHRAYQI
jgi:hypothetical protein